MVKYNFEELYGLVYHTFTIILSEGVDGAKFRYFVLSKKPGGITALFSQHLTESQAYSMG